MRQRYLESSAISAFCSSTATMLGAGIQLDEAVQMLADGRERSSFTNACNAVYGKLIEGEGLGDAMAASEAFPPYAVDMVRVGERTGRTERVLRGLGRYYESEEQTFAKLRSAVSYPAALLCVMSVILAFTVVAILPIFIDAYEGMAGSLTSASFGMVNASVGIGWASLIIVTVLTAVSLVLALRSRSQSGRMAVSKILERAPGTRGALHQLALSRFTGALATFAASGMQDDEAMTQAAGVVDHEGLKVRVEAARASMVDLDNPRSLAQAIAENDVFEPVYARMLQVGVRAGSADEVLGHLSDVFFEDASLQLDQAVNRVEPALAALLTIAVGATLVAVMLPLIGIMGSIA